MWPFENFGDYTLPNTKSCSNDMACSKNDSVPAESKKAFKDLGFCDNKDLGCSAYYARQQGSSHVAVDKPCQDYCLVKNLHHDLTVAAVADGHGDEKYPYSQDGSQFACESVMEAVDVFYNRYLKNSNGSEKLFVEMLKSRDFKRNCVEVWTKKVLDDFSKKEPETDIPERERISKYGTTLLFTVISPKYYVMGQLGDGAILLFKGKECSQLFKRHEEKYDSKTASMASSSNVEKMVVDSVKRDCFTNVLLSTDGIYDKIDQNDNFYLYGLSLVEQIRNSGSLNAPFTMSKNITGREEDLDISAVKSCRDDLTILLIDSNIETITIALNKLKNLNFTDIKFYRAYEEYIVYTGMRDNKQYELHIGNVTSLLTAKLDGISGYIGDTYNINLGDGYRVIAYMLPENTRELMPIYEAGELCEKKNITLWQEQHKEGEITNRFILKVYENLRKLLKALKDNNFYPNKGFTYSLRIDGDGNIYFFSDAVSKIQFDEFARMRIDNLLNNFNLLGYIATGSIKQPLFKTASVGYSFYYPHSDFKAQNMGRICFIKGKYGLQNLSEQTWFVYEENKDVSSNRALGLVNGRKFYVKCEEELSKYAEVKGNKVYYRIFLFENEGE
ncbi:MAG: protein phosphatase 2C domain-containing protein [Phascolarctobacterium sp.]|nr:protein phosphatase 2C domain-containing protein [Phascolarctobacterium sp.]